MARTWTEEQLCAITKTDQTVLLSAAAGSGKTATLTERLIRMITAEEHPLDVSRMLIVTFTKAAAKELRDRIGRALSDALAEHPENKHLLRSSLLLPTAKIRTIDSFCNDLVRGHTESLGIPSHYRIPDEAENTLLMQSLMDEVVNDAYTGAFRPAGLDVIALTEAVADARDQNAIIPMLMHLYEKLGGYPNGLAVIEESLASLREAEGKPFFASPHGKEIRALTEQTFTDYENGLRRAIAAADAEGDTVFAQKLAPFFELVLSCFARVREACSVGYTAVREALAGMELPRAPGVSDEKLTESGRLAKKYRAAACKDVAALYEKYYLWEEKEIAAAQRAHIRLGESVLLLLAEFDRRYADEKRRRGFCTYNDLEHFAYRLLWDENGARTPLAQELTASFDAVCIDEYQDVNYLQHRIFEAISTERDRFMVGDIKQSIYGFRGAMPEIFSELRRSMPKPEENKESAVLYLTKNFRSHGHLIDFNNGVFDFLFGAMGDSIGYREEDRLQTGKEPPLYPLPKPEILYLCRPRGTESTFDEWDLICDRIRALLASGRKPADIAVLLRGGKAKVADLSERFCKYGIPVCTEDKQNFFLYPEILLALCLLNTVNNPRRDIYLTGVLRSPLYGFTLEELITVRGSSEKELPLYDALTAYTDAHADFEKGRRFLADLAAFRYAAEGMAADKLCRHIFEKTNIYAYADADGVKRLRVLYDHVRQFEANAYHGLYRFVAYLNDLVNEGRSIGASRMLGESDGVQIITMHHSKGLEYPVCFVADAMPSKGGERDKMFFHPKLGLGFAVRDESGYALLKNPVCNAVTAALAREDTEEEARVLYVALTRASEELYITAHGMKNPDHLLDDAALLRAFPSRTVLSGASFLEWMLAAVGERQDLCKVTADTAEYYADRQNTPAPSSSDADEAAACAAVSRADAEAWENIYRERFSFVYPHEADVTLPGKISVSKLYPSYLDDREGTPFGADEAEEAFRLAAKEDATDRPIKPTVPFFLSEEEDDLAAKAGIATHLFLQFCDFSALLTTDGLQLSKRERVEQELERLVREGFIHPKDAARVRLDELAAFASSPLMEEILAAKEVYREFRFNTVLPATLFSEEPLRYEGKEIFTQGVIDILLIDPSGNITLADYKTDRLTPEMLRDPEKAAAMLFARHKTQLNYYSLAVERIFGKKPTKIMIYSLHACRSFSLFE